jgi:hypothetical protein
MTKSRPTAPWQFKLWHALLAIAIFNALCGAIAFGGLFGFVVFAAVCGLGLSLFGRRCQSRYSLISGVVLTCGALATLIFGGVVAVGVGHTTRQCTIEVVDEGDMPVRGASVHLREVVELNWPAEIPANSMGRDRQIARGITDGKGIAILPFEFKFTERAGLFVNEAQLWIDPQLWIQIDASGYDRQYVRLDQHLGRRYDYFKQPLPKMKVRLKASE